VYVGAQEAEVVQGMCGHHKQVGKAGKSQVKQRGAGREEGRVGQACVNAGV